MLDWSIKCLSSKNIFLFTCKTKKIIMDVIIVTHKKTPSVKIEFLSAFQYKRCDENIFKLNKSDKKGLAHYFSNQ